MRDEMEEKLSEFFNYQKSKDQNDLPSFQLLVSEKENRHRTPVMPMIYKVAVVLILIATPVFFIVRNLGKDGGQNDYTKTELQYMDTQMPTDRLPETISYVWDWKAPTDVLLSGKSSYSQIMSTEIKGKRSE